MKHLIFVIFVATIASTTEAALANQLNPQPQVPAQHNPQEKKPVIIPGERPPELPKIEKQLEISRVESPKLPPNQQLPSDILINRTLSLANFQH